MDNLEKVKRHLGRPIPIKLKNSDGEEDSFDFKPLNIEQQAILMELSNRIQRREKHLVDGIEIPGVNKEDMVEMFELLCDITKKSIQGIETEILLDFVNTNFDTLSDKISDLLPQRSDKEAIDKIRKRQEEIKLAKTS